MRKPFVGLLLVPIMCCAVSRVAFGSGSPCSTECLAHSVCNQPTPGVDGCGNACVAPALSDWCVPNGVWPPCGQTVAGHGNCSNNPCTVTGPACGWNPYGYAVPGDPVYGFGNIIDPCTGQKPYLGPEETDLVGLAAKGNIVVGDYTSDPFKNNVLPRLRPGVDSVIQPYQVDATDVALGYGDMTDAQGNPVFSGDYDRADGGRKVLRKADGSLEDHGERKFYESSLPDEQFRAILDRNHDGVVNKNDSPIFDSGSDYATVEAVLYTNHALAGYAPARGLTMAGSVVSRDEALIFGTYLTFNHDIRLLGKSATSLGLPAEPKHPRLIRLEECPGSECSP